MGNPVQSQQIKAPDGRDLTVELGGALPHSTEAEVALVSSVLADATGAAWALAQNCGVRAAAFHDARCRVLWDLLTDLRRAGQPEVDVALLAEELKLRGQLEEAGGFAGLSEITAAIVTSASTRYYAELVVLLWEQRHAVGKAAELRAAALAFESREKFAQTAGEIGQALIGLGRKQARRTMAEICEDIVTENRARVAGTVDKSRWVPTGLPAFDAAYRPFGHGGEEDRFVLLAGGSGHGKSVALRQIAGAALEAGQRVLAYTRETGTNGFISMLASAATGYDLDLVDEQPADKAAEFEAEVMRMSGAWADKKLFCVQNEPATPLITVEDLVEHARAWCHLHGVPELMLVDYLQIFDARKRIGGQSREAVVAYVSHTLQALQRELGCVMVVAAQLNETGLNEMRQVKRDENDKVIHRMPHRGDLRESQASYHDADRVIFLYVPPVDSADNDQKIPGLLDLEVWWYQEKRRKGRTGAIKTRFEKRYSRFVSKARQGFAKSEPAPEPAAGRVEPGARVGKGKYLEEGPF